MSHCVFVAADAPLPEVTPSQDYPLYIDLDTGTIFDGERMTIIACCPLTRWIYTARRNTEFILDFLNLPMDGSSKLLLICSTALMQAGSVEIWDVWLSGYWEFGDRPHICKRTALLTN